MKTAQELRSGNVIMVGADPLVVQKAEYNKSGRNAAVVKIDVYKRQPLNPLRIEKMSQRPPSLAT